MESDAHVEAILAAILHHVLVGANAGGFECLDFIKMSFC